MRRFFSHNVRMCAKTRQDTRFEVLGRVQCQEISALPGSLVDLSLHGCKIFYNVPVTLHLEDDYSLLLQTADSSVGNLTLICHPVWVNEDSGNTVLGMEILRSPDTERLKKFIDILEKRKISETGFKSQIVETQCQFI